MFEDILKFFRSLSERFRLKKKNISPFVIIICALLITVPTTLAVYYAYFYEDTSYLEMNRTEAELYDAQGNLIYSEEVSEADIGQSKLAKALISLRDGKIKSDTPSSLPEQNFKFSLTQKNKTQSFDCYFTDSHDNSYLTDSTGAYYTIEEKSFDVFLNSAFAEALYDTAKAPVLTTGNGDTVLPYSAKWNYKKLNGSFEQSTLTKVTDKQSTYTIGGSVNLSFDVNPDSSHITLYDVYGNEIYSGTLDDVPYVVIQAGSQLRAKLHAVWGKDDDANGYGTADYDFNIILKDRAVFEISSTTVREGGLVMLSSLNVDDTARIVFSITDKNEGSRTTAQKAALAKLLDFNPTFVRDGEYVRTLIPFPIDTPAGEYEISVSFGVTKQSFSVTLNERPISTGTINATSDDISPRLSKKALSSLSETLKNTVAPSNSDILYRGEFLDPTDFGFTKGYSFKNTVSATDGSITFIAKGNEYLADLPGGKAVPALNIGTVVAVGSCSYLGNYVAIEHGMGLRTWYCGLDSVTVSLGDVVAKGETVGRSGSQGLLSDSGVLILCSVYENLIDPSLIFNKEINSTEE